MNKTFKLSVLYGIIYAVCMFENPSGITFPILVLLMVIGLAGFTGYSGEGFTFSDILYATACIALSVTVPLTQNKVNIYFTKVVIFTLIVVYLVKKFYKVRNMGMYGGLMSIICFVVEMIANIQAPFKEINLSTKKSDNNEEDEIVTKSSSGKNMVLVGILVSIPILLVVLSLLTSADAVFRKVLLYMFDSLNDIKSICTAITYIFIGLFVTYSFAKTSYDKKIKIFTFDSKKYNPVAAITVSITLSLVYVLFSVIQVVALFGKGTYFLPEEYTYAQYAKEGFYQLVIVAIINMIIIFVCKALFEKNVLLQGCLTVISLCTFIMLASSAYRLNMYINTYHLTFARILGMIVLFVAALYMIGLTISIFTDRFPVFEYAVAATAIAYMVFALIRPDALIARENVNHIKEYKDVRYLVKELSYDAAPYLVDLEGYEDILEDYYKDIVEEYDSKDVRKFNVSEYKAYVSAKEYLRKHSSSVDFTSNK
ncbi:MAG: DUF4173 domain-containing protein [Lachnospiraceae bacterium]|nr:DUF4173 domain-containing protein [Lachnospiraceae bacterium]